MKKGLVYVFGIFILSLAVSGCACKSWDWVCTSCSPDKVSSRSMVLEQEVKSSSVQKVATPVVIEPVAPVVETRKAEPVAADFAVVPSGGARNFGDHRSSTLTTKAWQSLSLKDTQGVLDYTNKCVEMYSADAVKMQASLKDYPAGTPQEIFAYWAVNDVATALFIQGEAYRKAKDFDKAKAAYNRVINEFSFGQAYDPASKSFWKPAEAAAEGLYMIEKGLDLDFGDMTSQAIVRKMWESFSKKNLEEVVAYGMKLERLYGKTAKDMQLPLKDYPQPPPEKIHMFWALNDVGTGMFVLGEAYNAANMKAEAKVAYQKVIKDYFYAQCWDPQGWFWKPADAAQQKILEIEAVQ